MTGTQCWATPEVAAFVRAFGLEIDDGTARFAFLSGAGIAGAVGMLRGWRLFGFIVAAEPLSEAVA
jgi:hypothetical protein